MPAPIIYYIWNLSNPKDKSDTFVVDLGYTMIGGINLNKDRDGFVTLDARSSKVRFLNLNLEALLWQSSSFSLSVPLHPYSLITFLSLMSHLLCCPTISRSVPLPGVPAACQPLPPNPGWNVPSKRLHFHRYVQVNLMNWLILEEF